MVKNKKEALNELQLKLLEILMNIENEVITHKFTIDTEEYEVKLEFSEKTKRFLILVDSD